MDKSPWSTENIARGTTHTPRSQFDTLLKNIEASAERGRKKRFFKLAEGVEGEDAKSGGQLEVYGENPRIIVNEVHTEAAAVWYCLFDGFLLQNLESQKRNLIQTILKQYFHGVFPCIPIITTQSSSEPKYKLKNETVRIYSVHGGPNVQTFFKDNQEIFTFYIENGIQVIFKEIINNLLERGLTLSPHQNLNDPDELIKLKNYLDEFIELRSSAKEIISNNPQIRGLFIQFEVIVRIKLIRQMLIDMGIQHGHDHLGNYVSSWGSQVQTSDTLIGELIHPSELKFSYGDIDQHYPSLQPNVFLIDFDQASLIDRSAKLYNKEHFLQTLSSDTNEMHQIAALATLSITEIPEQIIRQSLETNDAFLFQLQKKLGYSATIKNNLSPQDLASIFTVSFHIDHIQHQERIRKLVVSTFTSTYPQEIRTQNWLSWLEFLSMPHVPTWFKQTFLQTLIDYSEGKGKGYVLHYLDSLTKKNLPFIDLKIRIPRILRNNTDNTSINVYKIFKNV